MLYKFHEDGHGEVVVESKWDNLDPYIGLHYPATDIPQATRFLFRQNPIWMIVFFPDSHLGREDKKREEGSMLDTHEDT